MLSEDGINQSKKKPQKNQTRSARLRGGGALSLQPVPRFSRRQSSPNTAAISRGAASTIEGTASTARRSRRPEEGR